MKIHKVGATHQSLGGPVYPFIHSVSPSLLPSFFLTLFVFLSFSVCGILGWGDGDGSQAQEHTCKLYSAVGALIKCVLIAKKARGETTDLYYHGDT